MLVLVLVLELVPTGSARHHHPEDERDGPLGIHADYLLRVIGRLIAGGEGGTLFMDG